MHYRQWGERGAPVLVALHGFLGSSQDWQTLGEALARDFQLISFDLPGHGQNRHLRLDSENGFADFHSLLVRQLEQLGIEGYSLLGYSLGGRLAMYHACQQPSGLDQLIVEAGHPGLSAELRDERWRNDQSWAERFSQEPAKQVLASWYQQPVFASLAPAEIEQLIARRSQQVCPELIAMYQATSLAKQPQLSAKLASLQLPFHYLSGEQDCKFSALAQQLAKQVPALRWHKFANAGHNCHMEQPLAFAKLLKRLAVR